MPETNDALRKMRNHEMAVIANLLATSGNANLQIGIKLWPKQPRSLRATLLAFTDHRSIDSWYMKDSATYQELECLTVGSFESADGVKTNVGICTLPDGQKTACFSTIQRFPDSDWFVFWLTMNGLSAIYPGEYSSLYAIAFQDPLISWLTNLAEWAFQHAPFRYAAIGWELANDEWEVSAVPERRTAAYLWPDGSGKLIRHLPTQ